MGKFSRLNKFGNRFDIDLSEAPFYKLSAIHALRGSDEVLPLIACYINGKSRFGAHPIAVTSIEDGSLVQVDLPQHLTDTVKEMIADDELFEGIKNGECGFTVREYESNGRTCYTVSFVDIE